MPQRERLSWILKAELVCDSQREKSIWKKVAGRHVWETVVDTLLKWAFFLSFSFSLWLQVEIYKTVKMHCIWHKQMVSSYYFYSPKSELSCSEEVFLRTASGTHSVDHDWRNNRKIDWVQWDLIKMRKFKVSIVISDAWLTLWYWIRILLRFQLMRIKFTKHGIQPHIFPM